MVITDPSGEIRDLAAGDLRRRGFDVIAVDLSNPSESVRYNPLAKVANFTDIKEVAHILIRSANPDYDRAAFWNSGAESILDILIQCLRGKGDLSELHLP